MAEKFNVCQFFLNEQYEYAVRNVDVDKALDKALQLASSVGAKIGMTQRVIITDRGDCICWEWKFGEGVTFPPVTMSDV